MGWVTQMKIYADRRLGCCGYFPIYIVSEGTGCKKHQNTIDRRRHGHD